MENNGYHLDLFTNSMSQYFNEVLIHKNYVSTSFRKYSLKNGKDAEFSFQIKVPASTSCDEKLLNQDSDSEIFIEEDFEKLINISQQWSLHLAHVSLKGSKIIFQLNQTEALYQVLKSILNEQIKYGVNFTIPKGVKVNVNESTYNDLSQLRLKLIEKTANNIMNALNVKDEDGDGTWIGITLTTKNPGDNKSKYVVCGVVSNAATGRKETNLTPEEYYNLHLSDIRTMSEQKYWETENEQLLHDLTEANVTMALMEVNPKHIVSLKLNTCLNDSGGSMSKGATFVLYNYARLVSIRKKFEEKCIKGIYPKPPNFDQLDFSLLTENEEWFLLFNYLLEYPTMIRKVSQDMCKGVVNTHHICRFLLNLSSLFSVYYRRVRVLLEPRSHLLPLIYARVQLLKGIEQVMENALSLLGIRTVQKM